MRYITLKKWEQNTQNCIHTFLSQWAISPVNVITFMCGHLKVSSVLPIFQTLNNDLQLDWRTFFLSVSTNVFTKNVYLKWCATHYRLLQKSFFKRLLHIEQFDISTRHLHTNHLRRAVNAFGSTAPQNRHRSKKYEAKTGTPISWST